MKLFYYEASKGTKKKYIVVEATNQMDGWNRILGTILSPQIKAGKFKPQSESTKPFDVINEVELDGEKGYKLSTAGYDLTKEAYAFISENMENVIVDFSSRKAFAKLNPNYKDIEKPEPKKLNGWDLFKKFFQRTTKVVPKHITVVDIKSKYPSRRDPVTGRWKPVEKPEIHQPEKSPNALVCIATKDRKEFKRVARKDASEIISTQLADEKEWEYISKEEYRKLKAPIPGRSFTPRLGEIGYTPRAKQIPNKSSSKVASKTKRKKNKKTHVKILSKESTYTPPLYDYEISFIRNYKEGSVEYVRKQTAKNEASAIYKATRRLDKEEKVETRLYRAEAKLLTEITPKKEKISQVKKTIMPQVIDLPIWKDRLGNIIPWFKKVTKITTEEERAKGAGIFKEDKEEVKTYTKYEVVYHRLDKSPFKEKVNLETSSVK